MIFRGCAGSSELSLLAYGMNVDEGACLIFKVMASLGSLVFENSKDLEMIVTSQNLLSLQHAFRCMYPDFVA